MKDCLAKNTYTKTVKLTASLIFFAIWSTGCEPLHISELETTEDSSLDIASLGEKALNIIDKNCTSCHGQGSVGYGGVSNITSFSALVGDTLIVPGVPEASSIYTTIANGSMPMAGTLSPQDVEVIRNWVLHFNDIKNIEPEPEEIEPLEVEQPTMASTLSLILDDLTTNVPENDRKNIRYFSFKHLQSSGLSLSEYGLHKKGFFKLLNSLSWAQEIVLPSAVDDEDSLFRVNLTDLQWTSATWDILIQSYPYSFLENNLVVLPSVQATDNMNTLMTQMGTQIPVLRADWFIHEAALPEKYHAILKLPNTTNAASATLEATLGININSNLQSANVLRAGFTDSNVSNNNRVIERHQSNFGSGYWKSYDFPDNAGVHSIQQRPLGPELENGHYEESASFQAGGGEIIFNLPNGLQAYMIVDGDDNRIDTAPTDIVQDPLRVDKAVTNGISCISCHTNGLHRKNDQIKSFVFDAINYNPFALSEASLQQVDDIYATDDELQNVFQSDENLYKQALNIMGMNATEIEPVSTSFYRYEKPLNVVIVSAELGVDIEVLRTRIQESTTLSNLLPNMDINDQTAISRKFFNDNFLTLYKEVWKIQ